jgi:hypothetical protein
VDNFRWRSNITSKKKKKRKESSTPKYTQAPAREKTTDLQ